MRFENLSLNWSAKITTDHEKQTKDWIPLIITQMGDGTDKGRLFLPERIGSILTIFPVSCMSSDY